MRFVVLLALLVFVSGCTGVTNQGLSITMQADPPIVFSGSSTLVHIDVDNRNQNSMDNVVVELFDSGMLAANKCIKFFDHLLPYEFQTISCQLAAPKIEQPVTTQVNARVFFNSTFSASQIFEVMDENEYQRRVSSGTFHSSPQNYIYSDRSVQVQVEFSEPPPLVVLPEKKYFVYFTISNIGDGFVNDIKPGDFIARDASTSSILECPPFATLSPNGKIFPRIACEIKIPSGYFGARESKFRNVDLRMQLSYTYELRDRLEISIIR